MDSLADFKDFQKNMNGSNFKITSRWNYIPVNTPRSPDYNLWYNQYLEHNMMLYSILTSSLKNRYKGNNIDYEKYFKSFCLMIFNKSSKHLPM